MAPDLPTTSSLCAFAGARWLSFKRAADVHLSPSVVAGDPAPRASRRTAAARLNPGLTTTRASAICRTSTPLERLEVRSAARQRARRPPSALESFSESWLVPRLAEFERAHPTSS
jgi:hypothetical protein